MSGRRLVVIGACVAIASSLLALRVDERGFVVNILAGLVTLFIGILVAVSVVDRFAKVQRQREWQNVERFTLRALAVHLCEITGAVFRFYDVPIGAVSVFFSRDQGTIDASVLDSFGPLLERLRKGPRPNNAKDSPSDVAIRYYEEMGWDLDQIQNVLTPRVIDIATNQRLIDTLVEFGDTRRALHHAIIAHRQAVTQGVFEHIVALIEGAARLYEVIWIISEKRRQPELKLR